VQKVNLWVDQALKFTQAPFAESVQRREARTSFLKTGRPSCAVRVFKDAGKVLTEAPGRSTGTRVRTPNLRQENSNQHHRAMARTSTE